MEDEDSKVAICGYCDARVPRGGSSTKGYTSINLVHHLSSKHKKLHAEYLEKKGKVNQL